MWVLAYTATAAVPCANTAVTATIDAVKAVVVQILLLLQYLLIQLLLLQLLMINHEQKHGKVHRFVIECDYGMADLTTLGMTNVSGWYFQLK